MRAPGGRSTTPLLFTLVLTLVTAAGLAGRAVPGVAPASSADTVQAAYSARSTSAYGSGQGLTVRSVSRSGRVVTVLAKPRALARAVRFRVVLPDHYGATTRRYPVLYLLHGTAGDSDDWLQGGKVLQATAGLPLIVVLPDGGYPRTAGSWWTNWYLQDTRLGKADWETFDLKELIPWVDAHLRTRAHRSGRAIAGLSQGGFGAFSYAARNPDLFTSAGSFSGVPDIFRERLARQFGPAMVGTAMQLNGVPADAAFGPASTHPVGWTAHNPASLVSNLRATDLRLWTGDGPPGSPSPDQLTAYDINTQPVEVIIRASNHYFADAADAAGVGYHLVDYGPGSHTWFYWHRDLVRYLPTLMTRFAHPPAAPRTIDYTSADRTWRQWGWQVTVTRLQQLALTRLYDAGRAGFTWQGADAATVTTPSRYAAGRAYPVVVGARSTSVVADDRGQLTVAVPAGTVRVSIG